MDSFAPSRLTLARRRRGFTMRELAAKVGVSAPAISQFEKQEDKSTPSTQTLANIAQALGYPQQFFCDEPVELTPPEDVSFRSLRSITATLRDQATTALDQVAYIIHPALEEHFVLPETTLPDLSMYSPVEAARLIRTEWKLGDRPAPNLVHLLEKNGVGVYWVHAHPHKVDACSAWLNGGPFVLVNSNKGSGDRNRWTVAHELGHLLLHRHGEVRGKEADEEADGFAGEFLLPEESFRQDCPGRPVLKKFFPLKLKWKVSIAAMVRRCHKIGVFSTWHYEQGFKEISRKGWRTKEPVSIPIEQSKLMPMIFERLARKGISPDGLAHSIALPSEELYELIPSIGVVSKDVPSPPTGHQHLRLIQ